MAENDGAPFFQDGDFPSLAHERGTQILFLSTFKKINALKEPSGKSVNHVFVFLAY